MADDNISIDLQGDLELQANMKKLGADLPGVLLTSMQRILLMLQGYAKANKLSGQVLKVRTGRLRSSITGQETAEIIPGAVIGKFGSNVVYARIHEYGGVINRIGKRQGLNEITVLHNYQIKIPARPYLNPTVQENQSRIMQIIRESVTEAVQNV